ncbi:putative nuclease HARBI1 [Haliotis asinina]
MAAAQRVYLPRSNRFNDMNDEELLRRYRLNQQGIRFLLQLIGAQIQPLTGRNHAIDATTKLLVTLRFLATGKFQLCNGDDHGLSQPSVSRAIYTTVEALSAPAMVARFIHFPSPAECQRNKVEFHRTANFPGVIGVIDGTHIQIQAPTVNEDVYVNRHHYHSINTQVVFDPFDRIIDIVARWPGSTHDSRILSQSGLFRLMESNNLPAGCHLLGDSGYPSKRWLLTPFLRPEPGSQARYNRAHKITRSCVERGIGQLKRRFGVLHGEIRQSPERTCKIIMAGAVLHNICKERNIPIPPADGIPQQQQRNAAAAPAVLPPQGLMGVRYREQFARTHFP